MIVNFFLNTQCKAGGFHLSCADVFIFKADLADLDDCKLSAKKQAVSDTARNFVIKYTAEFEGIPAEKLIYSHDSHGKPYIVGSRLHFNISHCGSVIAVAFCTEEIGADIELVRDFNSAVVKRYFTDGEKEYIFSADDKETENQRFFEIWTAKEAFLKYCGVGISGGFDFDTAAANALCHRINSSKLGEADVIHHNGNILAYENDIPVKNLYIDSDKTVRYCVSVCAREIKKINFNIK